MILFIIIPLISALGAFICLWVNVSCDSMSDQYENSK